jgi:transcriptional antiterminator NusG
MYLVSDIGGEIMTDAFIAFVRHEEELLLLHRSKSDSDSPGLWDGVYGIGDTEEDVLNRVAECTGIPLEDLEYVRAGPALGIDIGGRLQDIAPCLVVSSSKEVTPTGRYTESIWVDPGNIGWEDRENNRTRHHVFTDLDMEGSEKLLLEMYGSVATYLYIVKTAIGSEKRVADEMKARLMGSGSLSALSDDIFGILHPTGMRGYVIVESSASHHVEKLIGRSGGRDPKARRGLNQTPLKNAKTVLPGEAALKDILPYLEPKAVTSGIEVGCIVEIVTGAFKGEKARVTSVAETKEEVSMELYEQPIPMTLKMRGDHVRVVERVE